MTNKKYKTLSVQVIITILLFFFLEFSARIFLTRREFSGLAIQEFIIKSLFVARKRAYLNESELSSNLKCTLNQLLAEKNYKNTVNRTFTKALQLKYELGFSKFIANAKIIAGNNIVLLYLPNGESDSYEGYFKNLAEKYNVKFISQSNNLRNSSDYNTWTLSPQNGHLSRFGNKIIANSLNKSLTPYFTENNRNKIKPIKVKGGLIPNKNKLWNQVPKMVYRVKTNSYGFRNTEDIGSSPYAIFYGDSFTFGPYLPNHDTYPSILESLIRSNKDPRLSNIQIFNASIAGSTIFHEQQILKQTSNLRPNLLVLQVLDNDIFGVSSAKMKSIYPVILDDKSVFEPIDEEISLYELCKSN